MTLRNLPEAVGIPRPENFHWDAPSDALGRWAKIPAAQAIEEDATISVLDVIGEDAWTGGGVTAKRVSAALRGIGARDVTVKINSPGGDLFEGIAIYNILRAHPARVSVDVLGIAASAASVIAMAGDEIRMGNGTFMMVHNAWGVVIGNRHNMGDAADVFAKFDAAIADIYEARTGADRSTITALMDAETYLAPEEAISTGFADAVDAQITLPKASGRAVDRALMARRQTEAALARAGHSRIQRSELLAEIGCAAAQRDASRTPAARDAGIDEAAVRQLIETLKS